MSRREIARRLRVSEATVRLDLAAPEPSRPLAAPSEGNDRALQHGVYSEKRLAALLPVALEHARATHPNIDKDDGRLHSLAERRARISSAVAWLYEQGRGVVRDEKGDVWPVAVMLDKWQGGADRLEAELRAEGNAREAAEGRQSLESIAAELSAGEAAS